MDIQSLQLELQEDLKKQTISSSVLLGNFRLLSDKPRLTGAYQDPLYFPLYYHLGKRVDAKSLIE